MNEGQKVLMLTENYNVYKLIDNTIMGFFLGIISGIGLDVLMKDDFNVLNCLLFIVCIFSTILMLKAMSINSKFIQYCQDIVLYQNEYQNRIQIINKLTKDTKRIQSKFKCVFWLAIFILFFSIAIVKIPIFQKHSEINHNQCKSEVVVKKKVTKNQNNSKKTYHMKENKQTKLAPNIVKQ
jgi:hypothetical protein